MRRVAAVSLTVVTACAFEQAGLDPGEPPDAAQDAPPNATIDAPPGGPIDAGACPAAEVLRVQIDGVEVDGSTPARPVLVGDSVRISFLGSCVAAGTPVIDWTLSPIDGTSLTARGTDTDFTVYSVVGDEDYVLDVTLGSTNLLIDAFHTHGFETIAGLSGNDADIRHLDSGGGRLWISTKNHAWAMDLASPGSFQDLTVSWDIVETLPNGLRAVHHDGAHVWFATDGSTAQVYRGVIDLGYFTAADISHDLAFGNSTNVYNIEAAAPGVHVAADHGVTTSPTSDVFLSSYTPDLDPKVFDVALAPPRAWGGGRALYDLANPAVALYPFGGTGDQLIRHLEVDDDGNLWVASNGLGLARVDASTGAVIATWTEADGLASDIVDELGVDPNGDLWFGYRDDGIGRWKRDRDEIANLGTASGLTSAQLSNRAVHVDGSGGGRVIFAGTLAGLVYAHLP